MTDDSRIDQKAIVALQELGGDGFAIQMIDLFLAYAPKVMAEAREAFARGDLEPVVRMGHSLRSSGRNLGVLEMVDLAQAVESAGRAGDLSLLPSLLDKIEQAFSQAKKGLEAQKARLVA